MMISAQISIQIISARGPPLIIALKDVHKLEKQAEEPSFCVCVCVCRKCANALLPSPKRDTHITEHHVHTLSSSSVLFLQSESAETSVK